MMSHRNLIAMCWIQIPWIDMNRYWIRCPHYPYLSLMENMGNMFKRSSTSSKTNWWFSWPDGFHGIIWRGFVRAPWANCWAAVAFPESMTKDLEGPRMSMIWYDMIIFLPSRTIRSAWQFHINIPELPDPWRILRAPWIEVWCGAITWRLISRLKARWEAAPVESGPCIEVESII